MTREQALAQLTLFISPYSNRPGRRFVLLDPLLTAGTPLEAFYRWMLHAAVVGMSARVPPPITHWDVVGQPTRSQPFDPEDCSINLRLTVTGPHVILFPAMAPPPTSALLPYRFEVKAARRRSTVGMELRQNGHGGLLYAAMNSLVGDGLGPFRVAGTLPTPAAGAPL